MLCGCKDLEFRKIAAITGGIAGEPIWKIPDPYTDLAGQPVENVMSCLNLSAALGYWAFICLLGQMLLEAK